MILVSSIYSILVGVWIHKTGFLQPSIGTFVIYLFSVAYIYYIPESHIIEYKGSKFEILFRKEHYRTVFEIFFQRGRRGIIIRLCCIAFFIYFAAFVGRLMPLLLRIQRPPLKWKPVQIGVFMGVSSALYTVTALVLLVLLGRRLSLITLSIIGMTSCCVSNIILSFTLYDWLTYLSKKHILYNYIQYIYIYIIWHIFSFSHLFFFFFSHFSFQILFVMTKKKFSKHNNVFFFLLFFFRCASRKWRSHRILHN